MLGLIPYFGIFDLVCEDRDSKGGIKKDVGHTSNLNRIKKKKIRADLKGVMKNEA